MPAKPPMNLQGVIRIRDISTKSLLKTRKKSVKGKEKIASNARGALLNCNTFGAAV